MIHGGLGKDNKASGSLHLLNLKLLSIQRLQPTGVIPPPLQGHTILAVYPYEYRYNPEFAFFNPPQVPLSQRSKLKTADCGVWMFGGLLEDGKAVNDLRLLHTGEDVLEWVVPETSGTPPVARAFHTM
jgi:hypothetical protein